MLGSTYFATAAALLSALPAVSATGQAIITNYCDFDVYSWSVDEEQNPEEPTVISANGGTYSETFRTPAIGGVSIKLAPENNLGMPITQLEYTLNYDLWYDVSNVNCVGTECPFQPHGLYMHSGNGCPTVACTPGNLTCHGAYTLWDDNWASLCCTESASNLNLYLCSDSTEPPSGPPSPPSPPSPPKVPHPSVEKVQVTPPPKKQPPPPPATPVVPATEIVEVTSMEVVTVTVTPTAHAQPKARHVHDHAHAHAHAHRH